LPLEFRPATIPAVLRRNAQRTPDRAALVSPSVGADRTLTFAELDYLSDTLGAALQSQLHVRPGTRVGWLLDNRRAREALVAYHAVLKAGAVNVPINTRLHPQEIAHELDHAGCERLIVDQEIADAVLARASFEDSAVVTVGGAEDRFEALLERPADADQPACKPDDLAIIVYTSGTTGVPKGIEHTHASSLASGISWADCLQLGPNDVLQSPFPVFSGAGLHFNGLSALWAGATYVPDVTQTEPSLARLQRTGATVFVAVPSIYEYWLADGDLGGRDLRSLRTLDYGGAAMAAHTIEDLSAALPAVRLLQTYGFTEAGPGGTYLPEAHALERLGSIGSRAAGRFTSFRVIDDDNNDVEPGQVGEFIITGPSMMRGYHRDPQATEAVTIDGWVRSGDLVSFDNEGFLYFMDRRKDIIVRGGYNISAREVEIAIGSHPAVMEVAVFGVPHVQLGEDLVAAVVTRTGTQVDTATLRRAAEGQLAAFKVPRRFAFVDVLPKNAAGKVIKRDLSARFGGDRSDAGPANSGAAGR
jgi:acyl-CoA synthetase (AMP-forming)/AMP-acid ligase II